ncbi:MAG: DUF421 domain-containing protein [Bdellovibrionaceae bacterium]|nr:DUF421 domain-containing protein [Pseudobdellovibrionaceae bacterium]
MESFSSMLSPSLPWWEFIIRGAVVYFALLIMLKLGGRRQIGQLSPFDFVLLLILSNAVQNSMTGGDNSLIGGLIIAFSLVVINAVISIITTRNKKISRLIDGRPEVFIHNGKLYENILLRENISHDELKEILRKNGVLSASDVKYGVIEATGNISIIPKNKD